MKVFKPRTVLVTVASSILLLAALVGCGNSDSEDKADADDGTSSASCPGDPVKFGVISVLTGTSRIPADPSMVDGAKAAAAAVNSSCELGRPIEIVACDSKDDSNEQIACGRKMVSEGVVAYMGNDGGGGTNWFPITSEAGIPEIGGPGLSSTESTSPLWFPLTGSVHDTLAYATVANAALSDVNAAMVAFDSPAVAFYGDLFKEQTENLGGTWVGSFPVPATAVDMTQYAAQVADAEVNAVYPILGGDQGIGLAQQLSTFGGSLEDMVFIQLGTVTTCEFLDQIGSAGEGMWIVDTAWPVAWSEDNPGAQQFFDELKDADLPSDSCDVTEYGLQAWSAVHIMTELLKGSSSLDAKTLVEKLKTSGPIDRPELPGTINWNEQPFADDPTLSALRVSSDGFFLSRIVDGEPVMQSNESLSIGEEFTPQGN
jgi:ABC-type branched-subunit amino acid transport system substrate-binding protein